MKQTFRQHVHSRMGMDTSWADVVVDYEKELVYFYLWSQEEALCGVLKYAWKADKTRNNTGRYMNLGDIGGSKLFGLGQITDLTKRIYIVEGCMDALSMRRAGYAVLATMSNTADKRVTEFLQSLPDTIAVCDGDGPGLKLAKFAKRHIVLPEGEDPNSMPIDALKRLIEDSL